jgi:hypothetical protein
MMSLTKALLSPADGALHLTKVKILRIRIFHYPPGMLEVINFPNFGHNHQFSLSYTTYDLAMKFSPAACRRRAVLIFIKPCVPVL